MAMSIMNLVLYSQGETSPTRADQKLADLETTLCHGVDNPVYSGDSDPVRMRVFELG